MITLYDKSETNFEHNGIGSIEQDIIDPKIHWIDNGVFSFEFDYPLFAKHGLEITNSSIIKAKDPEQDNLFFVYKVIPSMGYIKVYCYHIFYKLAFNTINDTNIVGKNGQDAFTQLAGATQYPHKFQLTSDLTNIANSRVVRKNPVEILLDSNLDNSFINRWGGHIIRHGFNISMNQSYGSNKGYKIQHKKDLMGYEATIDETTVVTRIRPVGYDGLLLPEIYIDSPLINSYPEPRIQEYAYSDVKVGKGEGEFATAALAYAELRRLAKLEFSQNEIDIPKGIYKVDFVNLKETEEYKNFAPLKQILPGDIVAVEHEEDGININSQMVEYNWNPLLKEYIDLTLGNYERSFTSTINKLDKIQTDIKDIHNQIELVYLSTDGKNKIYHGETEPVIDQNSTEGDLWFKKNGDKTELWILRTINGVLQWDVETSDATQEELKAAVNDAILQADKDRTKAEQDFETAKQTAKEYTDAQVIAFDTKFEAETGAIRNEVTTGYNNAISAGKTYTDNKSAEFNTQLDLVKADVASTVLKADDAVTKANKAITDAGFMRIDLDATKVTAIDALTKAQTATDNVNSLSTSYDALTQTVGLKAERAQVNAISGVVDQHELKISANAQAITARLTSVQVDSLITGKGYVNQAELTATSSQWNLSLTQVSTDLSNLEIGGRNLLIITDELTGRWLTGNEVYPNASSGSASTMKELIPVKSGENLTFSKITSPTGSAQDYWRLSWLNSNKQFVSRYVSVNNNFTLIVPSGVSFLWASYPVDAFPKIEKGNKKTDWSPAPEDMATLEQFTTLDVKVNGIQMTVGNKAERSQVTQLAGQITSVVNAVDSVDIIPTNDGSGKTFRDVYSYTYPSSSVTGMLLIETPITSSYMTVMRITGYNYQTSNSNIDLTVSFYAYSTGAILNHGFSNKGDFKIDTVKVGRDAVGKIIILIGKENTVWQYPSISIESVKFSFSTPPDSYQNGWVARFATTASGISNLTSLQGLDMQSRITQNASDINIRVTKAELISQINIQADNILIQTGKLYLDVGSVFMTTAFVSDLNAKTLTAVTANIASIRTSMLKADVITSTHLKVDNAMMDKLTANTAVVNYLFTKTAFVDNLNAKTLNAVTANIVTIRGQVLIANVVQATHLQADVATLTKLFATDANVNVLTTKTAFINSVKAIDIAADRITAGTLNAALVNIINLNANRIATGTVSGANSAWNLNTGVQTYTNPSSGDVLTLTQGQILFTNGAQSRYLNYNAEGLQLVPGSGNTGTSKNTSLHLIGGGTGSYQYIQFASGSGITQRLEVEGQYMTAYHGSGGAFQVAKYGENPNSGVVISGAYETRHSTGVSLRIAGDSISTPRDGARNIFLTPQGVGSVISGNSSGVRYNMVASDFVKQSSKTTKKIIGPITEGLTVINRLTAITYYKLSKLNDGIVEIEKGFISEDSPDVATPDRKGIYDSHITAHLVKGMQELDQKVIAINSLATAANSIANNAMNKVFQIDNDVQNTKNKIVAIDSLVTAANSIATKAMNKTIQTDGEFQQMKNKILELEQEIKTLKGAA